MNKSMGTIWWSKASPIRDWPEEMKEDTPEQLENIEVLRDANGIITGARTKTAIIESTYSGMSGTPINRTPFRPGPSPPDSYRDSMASIPAPARQEFVPHELTTPDYRGIDCENCGRMRVQSNGVCEKCGYNNDTRSY